MKTVFRPDLIKALPFSVIITENMYSVALTRPAVQL